MIRRGTLGYFVLSFAMLMVAADVASAQYAAQVVSYDAGSTPAPVFGTDMFFDDQAAPLGPPSRFTNRPGSPGVVSPFSPPFLRDQIISIGESGQLTLRLSHYAIPQAGGPEIGVFTNAAIADADYPNGQVGSPPFAFGVDDAIVEVSEDGVAWIGLAGMNPISFDVPTSGYTDLTDPFSSVPGSAASDFQQPFTGSLANFDGLPYYDAGGLDVLDLLAGSGGGTWLDISPSGLPRVGYLRFSVLDDMDDDKNLNFEVDAVSIAHAAVGAPVPEPGTIILAAWSLLPLVYRRSRGAAQAEQSKSRPRARPLE